MSREYKFRVWDIDGGKMSAGFDIEGLIRGDIEIQFPTTDESLPFNDWIAFRKEFSHLMQYTGLKDKNGTEIYEGDLLMKTGISQEMTGRPPKTKVVGSIKKVVFNEGSFMMVKSNSSPKYKLASNILRYYQYEVIGNIYETPHLLNPSPEPLNKEP